jgi:hypothetical protein
MCWQKLWLPKSIYPSVLSNQREEPMDFLFLVSLLGVVVLVPLHSLSLEHIKLEREYGEAKGRRIGDILSYV